MINQPNKKKSTPLHIAAQCASYDVIEYLLDQGATGSGVDDDGDTVLARASISEVLNV